MDSLTKWQRDCLYQVEVTRSRDSGSTVWDFTHAMLFALEQGLPAALVAETAGLTTAELAKLVEAVDE